MSRSCPRRSLLSSFAPTLLIPLLLTILAACSGGGGATSTEEALLSADVRGVSGGMDTRGVAMPNGVPNAPSAPADAGTNAVQREVAAADVYAVAGDRLVLANAYRGLAIVDLADYQLVSRTPLRGRPNELYLIGARAFVVVTSEGMDTMLAQTRLVELDLTNAAAPVIVQQSAMNGWFRDSRKIGNVLYVLTSAGAFSFALANTPATAVAALPLAGEGLLAHATDQFVFVTASADNGMTRMTVLDIRAVGGAIEARGSVLLTGIVGDAQKLHFGAGTMRVVTHDSNGVVSHLYTIGVDNPDVPVVLGELLLARGEQLFGTCFMDDRAYIVTFERIDPLWVVDLSNPALPRVLGELQVPGFSTQVVCSGNQLVSLGYDGPWSEPVLSLFDVADPTRPSLLSRVPVGSVDPEAFHEHRALFVQSDLVLVPLWDGLAVIDRQANSLSVRGQVPVRGGSKRGLLHGRGLVAVGNEQIVVADPGTLAVRGSVTVAENVLHVAQLGDGTTVEVVQSGDQTLVRGTGVDLVAERVFAFDMRAAVLGWSRTGRVLSLFDCSTTPATVSAPIDIGFGGYAIPTPPRGGINTPTGGMFGYTSEPLDVQLPDGLLLIRGLPQDVAIELGRGDVRDGLIAVDLATGRLLPGVAVRGAAISGICRDGSQAALTLCRPAGFDRPGRPLVRNAFHRIDVRRGAASAAVPIPGAVIAVAGAQVHTMSETWDSDWSFRTSVTSLRVDAGKVEVQDRTMLPPFAYDFRVGSGILYYSSNDMPIGPTSGDIPQFFGNRIDSLRLSTLLVPGPSLVDEGFRRPLLAEGLGLLCARDAQTIELWSFQNETPARQFAVAIDGYPLAAVAEANAPGSFLVAAGYAGSVRVP